ncbi:MAG: hypothetical protein J5840_05635, partial [Lachnospiraceae bacterium]|nr:hypothetical protein [Lachnospiraceae bacterium]
KGVSMKKKRTTIIGIIGIVAIAVMVIVVFWMQSRKNTDPGEPEVDVSQVMDILLRDIDKTYPPTPKEVLKYYSEITCCFYNDSLTQEQLEQLAERSYVLYDDELKDHMSFDQYLEDLQQEVLSFQAQKIVVSGYSVSAAADVERFSEDGFEWARLYATYRLRQGTEYLYSNEVFLLRKDDDGHWKIYGFDLVEDGDVGTLEEEKVFN